MNSIQKNKKQQSSHRFICRCNKVSQSTIENLIVQGITDLNEIADKTSAGIGPCGGSCRRVILYMINYYNKNGFLSKIPPKIEDLK